MKNTICLLVFFVANHSMAQLKVEELTNDSLRKVFISQQTGCMFQDLHFVDVKELKERKVAGADSKLDSVQMAQYLVADFNKDAKKDLVISYAVRKPLQKYIDGFYIMAFVSNISGGYQVRDFCRENDYLFGAPIKMLSDRLDFVIVRLEYEFRQEKLKFDTVRYFQGEFINVNESCARAFDSIKYYTTSNWVSSYHQYSHLVLFSNMTMKREDFYMGKKRIYTCSLKPEVFDSLYKLICEVNVWNLKDTYAIKSVMDAGTSHLVISHQGTVKTIDDYGRWEHFGLRAIYDFLGRVNSEAQWTLLLPPKIEYKPRKKLKLN